jgi:hypothetical protein
MSQLLAGQSAFCWPESATASSKVRQLIHNFQRLFMGLPEVRQLSWQPPAGFSTLET